jgi:hypothetical protein
MSPWWTKHARSPEHCLRCKSTDDVHRDLCRRCRTRLLDEASPGGGHPAAPVSEPPAPVAPSIEPAHSRPWVHKGSG